MVLNSDASIMVISDIHAQFPVIEDQLTHARDTLGRDIRQILVLGDFGLEDTHGKLLGSNSLETDDVASSRINTVSPDPASTASTQIR